jgi:hypothetical protein
MDVIEGLVHELEVEKSKQLSWAMHYDEMNRKFEIICNALYKIRNLDPAEEEACGWIAKTALKDTGEWPR